MQTYKSRGIVFKSIKYGETSVIIDLYTRQRGLRSFIINGVRRSKTRSGSGLYRPLSILEVVAFDQHDDKLARIKEAMSAHIYQSMLQDVIKANIALFSIELARNTIKEKEGNPELYDFLESWLIHLDATNDKLAYYPLRFLIGLCSHLGFAPTNNYSEQTYFDLYEGQFYTTPVSTYYCDIPTSANLHNFLSIEVDAMADLKMTPADRSHLLDQLMDYIALHIPHFKPLKSLPILRQILH